MIVIINNYEIEIDIFDLEEYKKLETSREKAEKEMQNIEALHTKEKITNLSFIEKYCHVVKKMFEEMFGESISESILGKKLNYKTCTMSYLDYIKESSSAYLQMQIEAKEKLDVINEDLKELKQNNENITS